MIKTVGRAVDITGKKYGMLTVINKEDAIKARKEAEEKYFGEYSYSNSILKGVGQIC